jgi:hypothetical protein
MTLSPKSLRVLGRRWVTRRTLFVAKDRLLKSWLELQNQHHAARTRRVSAVLIAPPSGEVATQFQSDSSPTDSPVRVRYAQPGSPVSGRHGWVRKMLPTRPRPSLVQTKKGRPFMPARSSLVTLEGCLGGPGLFLLHARAIDPPLRQPHSGGSLEEQVMLAWCPRVPSAR